jgi:glutathione synthase/RimK-type ligase-like ATP-grasp enzyme
MRLAVVGNPQNRRVASFAAAVRRAGLPEPVVTPWQEIARGGAVPPGADAVRIDSPGEDPLVDRLLRGAQAPALHGQIIGLRAFHDGLIAAVSHLENGGAPLLNPAQDVATLGDKRACHAVLAAAGVAVPRRVPAVGGYADLRSAGSRRVFVKPAHGSSASGVVAMAFGPGGRVVGYSSVEREGDLLFNSLRVRRYDREADLAAIVDTLAPDGLHVEEWLPKATFGGCVIDLRVVVVAGRPSHVVVRAGRSPMTNLHLGNARGDVAGLRAAVGEQRWAAALDTCVAAASRFSGSLHVGVDLLLTRGYRGHAVAEVNSFGDLLPGLIVDGRDTYAEEVDALTSGRFDAWRQAGAGSAAAESAAAEPAGRIA